MRNKKLMKMGLSAVTVVAFLIAQIAVFSVAANRIVLNEDNVYLVGPIDDGHLAVVDTFGVFVKNDFIITGSDSEGRVAVGGTFNSPNMSGYAMNDYGLFPQYASAVIGENLMGGRINVKGNPTIIEGQNSDVFCFDEYFDVLEQVSQAFSEQDLGEVGPGGWCLLFTGDNEYINFFNVSVDLWNVWSNKSVVVPNNSKVVINIIGDGVPQLRGGIELGGTSTDGRDKTHLAERILLNVVDAENALITSSVGASIFAPKSKIIGSNGHIFGQTICKEFVGAGTWNCTEFGAEIFGLDEATKLIGFEPEVPDEDDDDTTNGGDDDTTNGGDDDTTNGGDDDTTNGGGDDTTNGGDDDTTNGGDDDTTNGGDDDTTNGGDDDTTNGGDDDTTNGGDDDTTNGGDDDTTNGGDDDTTNGGDDDTTNGGDDDTTNGSDDDTTNGGDDDTTNGDDGDNTTDGDDNTANTDTNTPANTGTPTGNPTGTPDSLVSENSTEVPELFYEDTLSTPVISNDPSLEIENTPTPFANLFFPDENNPATGVIAFTGSFAIAAAATLISCAVKKRK